MGLPRWYEPLAVAFLLAILAFQLGRGVASDGLTQDEVLYIGAGYRHLTASDYRLNPTTPPLAKMLAATGLLGLPLREPEPEPRPGDEELAWCYRFIFEENDPGRVILRARVPVVLMTMSLAVAVWAWARSAAGPVAGALALALAIFHPSLLAHGHLATTDLPATFAMLLASWAYWRWSADPTPMRAVLVGVLTGLAVATRLTGLLLVPAFVIAAWPRSRPVAGSKRALAVLALALVVMTPVVVWGAYGFHRDPWPGASVVQEIAPRLGVAGRALKAAHDAGLLPAAFVEGVRYQLEHNLDGHPAYLLGHHSKTGWPHYFVVAFLVKNTPGFLLAGLAAAILWWRRGWVLAPLAMHWLAPAAVVFAAASFGHIQIGERYILPVYPYLILLAAVTLAPLATSGGGRLALGAMLALNAGPALMAAPAGHLAYFNTLAGGSRGGHRVLLDSNLDWGQDLPRLAAWMRLHGVERVQLAYHGADDPGRYGIDHEDLPGAHLHPARPAARPFEGVVVVSPNLLYGVLPRFERTYETLRARTPDDRAGSLFVYRLGAPAAPRPGAVE